MSRWIPLAQGLLVLSLLGSCVAQDSGQDSGTATVATAGDRYEYKLLATAKTSTMQKELNEAADSGYQFQGVMGGETGAGGKEVVVVVGRPVGSRERERYDYLLLATNKTSTMQKELQHAANTGYEYKGQTIFESAFGGKEVVIILERDHERRPDNWEYKLLATTKTSTMQKELAEAAGQGFQLVGLTVAGTSFGGNEVVTILRRTTREHAKAQAEN